MKNGSKKNRKTAQKARKNAKKPAVNQSKGAIPNIQRDPKRKPKYYIIRASMTINGVTYYARDYGKRGFLIPIY